MSGLEDSTDYWFRARAVPASGPASDYTTPVKVMTTTAVGVANPGTYDADVQVGSFNIFGINADKTAAGNRKVWKSRESAVASDILGEMTDVVGLQEANQPTSY